MTKAEIQKELSDIVEHIKYIADNVKDNRSLCRFLNMANQDLQVAKTEVNYTNLPE